MVTLEGKVVDGTTGDILPNANIAVKNTLMGTTTDGEGKFSLMVDSLPATLVVSYIGYQVAEIMVEDDAMISVALLDASLQVEDVTVVGSRFAPRTAITSPVPIDNIKASDLNATGQLTFDKMLSYTVPAFNSTQQTISDATAHFDPADLRGLGPSRTLVLVNGKRRHASALVYINDTPGKGEVGVDMKGIPAAAIERIEVLRDGASAQYGSDAIAGVINIILKDDYEDTQVDFFTGTTTEGDGDSRGYSVNTGFKVGRNGFINLTHTFSDYNETNRAGEPGKDDLFGVGADNTWIQANPDLGMKVGLPNITTSDISYNSKIPLENNAEFYSFGGFQFRKGLSYALRRTPYWIPDPNFIHHSEGEVYGGFQPTFETDIFDNSLAFGLRGQTRSWEYDISYSHGRNEVDYSVASSLNTDLGAQSPTFFEVGGYEFKSNVTNLDLSRRLLNAQVSMGTEFRTENFLANAGEEASYEGSGTQSFPGVQPQNEADAIRYNIGIYGDVAVDLTEDVLVGGAARLENYSDFGESFTWKANGRFKFLDDMGAVRASASTGFRAPALHQIHLSNVQTLVSGGTVSNQGTFDNQSPVLRALDVPSLKEEEATNFTAGLAVRPLDGLYLSLDYYQVDVDDRIVYSSSIASDDASTVVGGILAINSITSLKFFTNAVDTRTKGIDLVASYAMEAGPGALDINFSANFNDTEIQGNIATPAPIADTGIEIFDRKEQGRILSARPDSKILVGFTYEVGDLRATLNNTRFGEVVWQHAADPSKDQTFAAKVITDLSLSYQYSETMGFGLGVQNLLDVYPDKIDTKGDVVTDLGGRFQYPWEVNQFGFAGTMGAANISLRF
ncbi:MAG: TonB-dependent receptor plug domain-containing protein [Candidatus Latescibacteria bacterium]|nr:TonB-dependent receptor plug domain-containing protein [Candidatus Latescibacterota bacterium]